MDREQQILEEVNTMQVTDTNKTFVDENGLELELPGVVLVETIANVEEIEEDKEIKDVLLDDKEQEREDEEEEFDAPTTPSLPVVAMRLEIIRPVTATEEIAETQTRVPAFKPDPMLDEALEMPTLPEDALAVVTNSTTEVVVVPEVSPLVPETPAPEVESSPAMPPAKLPVQKPGKAQKKAKPISKRDIAHAHAMQERCRQLCLSTFFQGQASVHSLGFTSSIGGEGKSFLAMVMAGVLAEDSSDPVTLLECNWEHPCVHEVFNFGTSPGLAEWLRGECSEADIRHEVGRNLTVIPAGDGKYDSAKLLQQMRQKSLLNLFSPSHELFVVDLPPVITSAYGTLAASLVESLVIVLRAGVTTDLMVAETYDQLKNLPIQGVVLNQVESRIPRWIRQLL